MHHNLGKKMAANKERIKIQTEWVRLDGDSLKIQHVGGSDVGIAETEGESPPTGNVGNRLHTYQFMSTTGKQWAKSEGSVSSTSYLSVQDNS